MNKQLILLAAVVLFGCNHSGRLSEPSIYQSAADADYHSSSSYENLVEGAYKKYSDVYNEKWIASPDQENAIRLVYLGRHDGADEFGYCSVGVFINDNVTPLDVKHTALYSEIRSYLSNEIGGIWLDTRRFVVFPNIYEITEGKIDVIWAIDINDEELLDNYCYDAERQSIYYMTHQSSSYPYSIKRIYEYNLEDMTSSLVFEAEQIKVVIFSEFLVLKDKGCILFTLRLLNEENRTEVWYCELNLITGEFSFITKDFYYAQPYMQNSPHYVVRPVIAISDKPYSIFDSLGNTVHSFACEKYVWAHNGETLYYVDKSVLYSYHIPDNDLKFIWNFDKEVDYDLVFSDIFIRGDSLYLFFYDSNKFTIYRNESLEYDPDGSRWLHTAYVLELG